uniref:TonB-dependent receptor domain-containing protein n=1 Tax=uncultured Sphingomonas sp. TaxID=158754 RepID=UPI0035C9E561
DNKGDYYSTVYNMNRLFKDYVIDATIAGKFATGPIDHEIVAGLSSLTDQFLYDNPTRNFVLGSANNSTPAVQSTTNAYVFNIYDQNNQPTIIGNAAAQYNNRPPVYTPYQEIHQRAAYISDTASYGPLSVLVGVRYTHYDEFNTNPDGSAISTFRFRPFTPIYAVTLKLPGAIRAYVSYVQALQDGAIAPATATNSGASFGPLNAHQYEAGLKSAGRWGNASLAVFRIVQPSEYVDGTNNFVRDGNARYQGIEFNAGLKPVAGLYVSGSVSYLDAKQVSGKPALIGERIPGTTSFQASAQVEYALPFLPGTSVVGGIRHSGNALGGAATNTINAFVYPGNTVGDLGASYAFDLTGHSVTLRANVQNLTDKHYWVPNSTGTGISAGEPRTFSLAAQVALNSHHDGVPSQVESASTGGNGNGYYLGLDAGAMLPLAFNAATTNSVANPGASSVPNALAVHQKTGWDIDGVAGYDLGLFSAEIEAGFKRYGIGAINYNNATVPIEVTGQQHAAGVYDGGGRTGVLSVLFNGIINLGRRGAAWRGFVGGGVGLARISSGEWTLAGGSAPLVIGTTATAGTNTDKSVAIPTYFSNDNATAFAWQGLLGVRRAITDRIDLTLKYRFFEVPTLKLRLSSGNESSGKLQSSSLQVGATFHL